MSSAAACATDVLHTTLAVARDCMKDYGVALPSPIVDGGGPSSTFTAAVFGSALVGTVSWGTHVALRLPDAIFSADDEPALVGPHIGVFSQVFFNIPSCALGEDQGEALTRALIAAIGEGLGQPPSELLFRAYSWDAGSTKMTGEAKEVNLAAGVLRGLEVAQLNRIEAVGGIKLNEPVYLLVIGTDRIAYALRVIECLRTGRLLGLPEDFYPVSRSRLDALVSCQQGILHTKDLRPGLKERLEVDMELLEAKLANGQAVCEEDMKTFRRANITLEMLFVTRAFDGSLRQSYIGRIGAIAGLLAEAFLAHPRETLALTQEKATSNDSELVACTERLSVAIAEDCARHIGSGDAPPRQRGSIASAARQRHAELVVQDIGYDLPDRFPASDRQPLRDWIIAHYESLGAAVGDGESALPLALAALRTAEESFVIERDLAIGPEELRARISNASFAGASGDQRRRRLERLFSVLEGHGIPLPRGIEELIPLWGLDDLMFCSIVVPGAAQKVAQAWLELRLPGLDRLYASLAQTIPPEGDATKHAWAVVRLESASRYLLVRAAANKPLWQDPYGARRILNRELLPLWRSNHPPAVLTGALIEEAVSGTDYPRQTAERVRHYLRGKLLSEER